MARYLLRTWRGTFVFFDPASRQLRHDVPSKISRHAMVVVEEEGRRRIEFIGANIEPFGALRAADKHYEIHEVESGQFSIRGPGFLCATPDGFVARDRPSVRLWERFDLVDLPAIDLPDGFQFSVKQRRREYAIPKLIHQTAPGRTVASTVLPEHLSNNVARLRQDNPGYAHTLWTDKEIHDAIYDWYGYDILDSYLRINPRYGAARADFFRYLCLYQTGGIYLDIKSGVNGSIDDIVRPDDSYLLSMWGQAQASMGRHQELVDRFGHGEYQQWFIISQPGHPFLASVIEEVVRRIHFYTPDAAGTGGVGVWRTTGPIAYTIGIEAVIDRASYRLFDAEQAGLIYNRAGRDGPSIKQHYTTRKDDVIL